MDEIARRAGVGVGTLYRHFPNRDALIEAVYRAEVEKLADMARQLARTHAPLDALRAWMLVFVDYVAAKQLIAPALNVLVSGSCTLYQTTSDVITTAIDTLTARAVASGDLRADVEPMDLLRALVGVSNVAAAPDWAAGARRLVDILIAGSRSGAQP
ncbi:TetR family transcriptional regulator [Neoasaia chiangmaiensis NBRC 101099]|nr:TetR family transcriptional regulator [Neoasaia chiangmaiensis NBRC 101099]GEN15516.1 hypothetical protein NCH01_19470 [Neoasaia chiangmaiensis]